MGLVQSLLPFARPMKLATPTGAIFGNKTQCKSPAVVWMIAVGSVAGAAVALWVGSVVTDGAVDACAAPSRDVQRIRTMVCNRVRMDAPNRRFCNLQLYDSPSPLLTGFIWRLILSASRNTRSRF